MTPTRPRDGAVVNGPSGPATAGSPSRDVNPLATKAARVGVGPLRGDARVSGSIGTSSHNLSYQNFDFCVNPGSYVTHDGDERRPPTGVPVGGRPRSV